MSSAWYHTTLSRAPSAERRAPSADFCLFDPCRLAAALLLAVALLLPAAMPAAAQSTRGTTVWSATLTVDSGTTDLLLGGDTDWPTQGCSDYLENFDKCGGVGLTNVTFAYANTNYVVKELLLYQPNVPT
ncbi:MAG: hypothetical protein OXF93_06915, partial [Acidobacteria bacterium]|nr:hypothetical protein [Acidobacteriota bacterium]